MCTLYKNIVALCDEKGIKGGKMCTDIGISKGLLTDLKMGRRSGVSAVTAQKIASYFDVSVGYLLGDEKETEKEEEKEKKPTEYDGLPENTKKLIDLAKSLPDDRAKKVLQMLKLFLEDIQ